MSYVLEFTKVALADIEKHKKAGDKAVLKKIAKRGQAVCVNSIVMYVSSVLICFLIVRWNIQPNFV